MSIVTTAFHLCIRCWARGWEVCGGGGGGAGLNDEGGTCHMSRSVQLHIIPLTLPSMTQPLNDGR